MNKIQKKDDIRLNVKYQLPNLFIKNLSKLKILTFMLIHVNAYTFVDICNDVMMTSLLNSLKLWSFFFLTRGPRA